MELTFVHQYGDSIPKRRRLAKACESCRARKKRCTHFANANPTANGESQTVQEEPSVNDSSSAQASPPIANRRRFVSDLNPEATLLPHSTILTGRTQRPDKDIGVWVDKREWEEFVRQKNNNNTQVSNGDVLQRPHAAAVAALIDIYFTKIHPILPFLNEAEFRRDHADGVLPALLVNAVCVVAAKDAAAEPHLRLHDSPNILEPREFCSRLHVSIAAVMQLPPRCEKITLVRTLILASLHAEGQDGSEEASMCLTQAMHYTQTLGWHLGQQTSVAIGYDLAIKRLFWCLWSLDRVNAAIYGRPIMMSDIDIAIESFEPGESGSPAFEVWLRLCGMLNKIISFYRPGVPLTVTGWEDEYPSFEEAVDAGRAWTEPQSVLATLHLFFLQVTILSHRSRGVRYVSRATPSYVRQSLCSIELIRLMNSNLFEALHPLPILPYAISLALSVSYQHLRQAHLQHQQEDARDDFRSCCQVLEKLRRTWPSADVITTIAKKVLAELDKTSDLSSFRVIRLAEGRDSPCTASLNKPHTLMDGIAAGGAMEGTAEPNGDILGVNSGSAVPVAPGGLFEGIDDIFGT